MFLTFLTFLIILSYSFQIIKINKNKNANGISYQSYLVGMIASFSLFMIATDNIIKYTSLVSFIMSLINLILILFYHNKTNYHNKIENKKTFLISLFFSFIGVFGVAQSIKTYKYKGVSNVNIYSYSMWFFIDIILILKSTNILTTISLFLSIIFYSYIIYKNKKI